MPCDTIKQPNQTISERKAEVKKAVAKIAEQITQGRVKVKIGPQGGVVFVGVTEADRSRVTDACIYRRIMSGDSALAKAAIARAGANRGADCKQECRSAWSPFP